MAAMMTMVPPVVMVLRVPVVAMAIVMMVMTTLVGVVMMMAPLMRIVMMVMVVTPMLVPFPADAVHRLPGGEFVLSWREIIVRIPASFPIEASPADPSRSRKRKKRK
jgi:hypothetical protein